MALRARLRACRIWAPACLHAPSAVNIVYRITHPVIAGTVGEAQMEPEKRECDVCGRDLPPKKGKRGRRRSRHRECTIAMAHLTSLRAIVPLIRFKPPTRKASGPGLLGHAKRMRSELHGLTSLVTVRTAKSATTDRDYYAE